MREFDFRFPGLDPLRNPERVERLRDCLLELAGGFTEIRPGILADLLPGEGTGYLVALPDQDSLEALRTTLARLADEWGCKVPDPKPASEGPRRGFGFFLVPKLANRDARGHRRDLFTPKRWALIRGALTGKLSHPVILLYGEWLPLEASREVDKDASYIFVFHLQSPEDVSWFERFIQTQVFDNGKECDQETIYLSAAGESIRVSAWLNRVWYTQPYG